MDLNRLSCHVWSTLLAFLARSTWTIRLISSMIWQTDIALFEVISVSLNFIKDLINLLNDGFFTSFSLEALCETSKAARHRLSGVISSIDFTHNDVSNGVQNLRLRQTLSLANYGLNGFA